MNFHADDPRLTAYLLGELSADEAAAVARAAAADPAIGLALRELQATQRLLANTFASASGELLPNQRSTVLRAARHADQADTIVTLPSARPHPWRSVLQPVAAAAAVVLATFLIVRLSSRPEGPATAADPADSSTWTRDIPTEIAMLPATGPRDPGGLASADPSQVASHLADHIAARDRAIATTGDEFLRKVAAHLKQHPAPPADLLPGLTARSFVAAADHPALELPVLAGRASLGWITHSVRTDKQLPAANAVRLEEILNHFTFRPAGPAGTAAGVSLAAESFPCPWKPSATLVMMSLTGAPDGAREVKATLHTTPGAVTRYRLLGFALPGSVPANPLPSRLPAKTTTTLVIELEPAIATGTLGTIEWSVDSAAATPLAIASPAPAAPASADARFAALVCAYAQWLANDPAGRVDSGIVSALARQTPTGDLPADRQDFLKLVQESLALAGNASR